ncbi:MAG: phosphotransferase [Bacteroidaceae bacterium]|nr:phosphotransferase [Bacteroidaceae bacterium]
MKLYRFKTFTTTYYFPRTTKETKLLYGLYSPFGGILSKIYWTLFQKSNIIRSIRSVDSNKTNIPYNKIRELEGGNSIMSFNMGSPGIEQKISILGFENNHKIPFFAKFSQKPRAIELTKNEIAVYKLLSDTKLVPVLYKEKCCNDYAFLKCEYIKGERPKNIELTKEIIQLSITLNEYHLTNNKTDYKGLKTALSHGDFCPWNMLEHNGAIRLIDWELAAERPLGYDIFTFIIQTSILLSPKKSLNTAIKEKEDIIKEYFNTFGINNYIPYLQSFVKTRQAYETSKGYKDRALRLNEILKDE